MKIIVCIPARYESTRLPGKMLAKETGKFLIQHTYEQAIKAKLAEKVIIAADDERIVKACEQFGAPCILTDVSHQSGTDRIAQAVADEQADIVVNVQGDEPQIEPGYIDKVAKLLVENENAEMATLAAKFTNVADVSNPNIVKVIIDNNGKAVYFSRSVIPFNRDSNGVGSADMYLRHLGIYAYRKDFLMRFTKMEQSSWEKTEKLEQLRAIENGVSILAGVVERTADGIDTAEQYVEFVKRYLSRE